MRRFLVVSIAVILPCVSPAWGLGTEEGEAKSIRVRNDSAMMRYHKSYFFTLASGEVGREGIPTDILIGDSIRVKDHALRVNHIFWTRYRERVEMMGKVLANAGDVRCMLVETLADVPYGDDERRDRLWILVNDCEILK